MDCARKTIWLFALLFPGCVMPATPEEREALARDLEDVLTVAAPLLGEDGAAYAKAVGAIATAILVDDLSFDFEGAFAVVRSLEPQAHAALVAQGQSEAEAAAILALARFALRRLESSLRSPGAIPDNSG